VSQKFDPTRRLVVFGSDPFSGRVALATLKEFFAGHDLMHFMPGLVGCDGTEILIFLPVNICYKKY